MKYTWRWFGPNDPISLTEINQAGVSGIVSALHHVPTGTAWTAEDVASRAGLIAKAGLSWDVVESIPVHEDIKRGKDAGQYVDAFVNSMRAVAASGIKVICYNFMPVLDWTRTNIDWAQPDGAGALRFDMAEFVAFDMHVLKRKGAADDYAPEQLKAGEACFAQLTVKEIDRIEQTVIAGLPGAELHHDRQSFTALLASYDGIGETDLKDNLRSFIAKVAPMAEELGLLLCMHPDDPPIALFGLPRVVSNLADYKWLLGSADISANGVTFCTGSLGAAAQNQIGDMFEALADRVHFLHLRNVTLEPDGSFYESEHLEGRTDIVGLIRALLKEEKRRKAEGRADWQIPMRPDHGHLLDCDRHRASNPGYSYAGRLKGLAELRGVAFALEQSA
ncbi:MAG: mannonate dehydratase [Paracoccaceae bacterium]